MKKKMIINLVAVGFGVILIIVTSALLLKNDKPLHNIQDFEEINIAVRPEFEIVDFKNISYKEDEARLQQFLQDYMIFLTDEYYYSKDKENEVSKKYADYFTEQADNIASKYEYTSEFIEERSDIRKRYTVTDLLKILDTKMVDEVKINIISKNKEDLKWVNKEGIKYNILATVPTERNKKASENGVYMNYGGERVKEQLYLEFEVFEYENNLKIHKIKQRRSKEGIESFVKQFKLEDDDSVVTTDKVLERIKYNKNVEPVKYISEDKTAVNTDSLELLTNEEITRVSARNMESTVVILNLDDKGVVQSLGSGFFIKPGIILTNCHVISGAKDLKVNTYNGQEYEVDGIVSANGSIDLAIIKLNKEVGREVVFGNLSDMSKLEPVIAIGHPFGNVYTVTAGVFDDFLTKGGVAFIQSAVPLSPGNSGGPLLNDKGEVVAINTAITNVGDTALSVPYTYIENIIKNLEKFQFSEIKVVA